MTRWVIGDIHGCLDELLELINNLDLQPEDQLILAGDLIDRGPDSPGVVDFAMNLGPQVRAIQGNHDEKCIRWFRREAECSRTGRKNPMRAPHPNRLEEWKAQTPEAIQWLSSLPITIDLGDWIVVHGGFEDKPLEKQKPDKMLRCRFVSEETGEMVPISIEDDPWENPHGAVWWATKWKGTKNVVYGHAVHSLSTPRVDRAGSVECWGIDTGCVFGGRLTALNLDTREIVQVQARKTYAAPPVKLAP